MALKNYHYARRRRQRFALFLLVIILSLGLISSSIVWTSGSNKSNLEESSISVDNNHNENEGKIISDILQKMEQEARDNPKDAEKQLQLARAYSSFARYDQAIDAYQKVLAIKPGQKDVELELAITYYLKGDYDQSLAKFTELERKYPQEPDIYFYHASVLAYGKNDYQQAITLMEKYVKLQSDQQEKERAQAIIDDWRERSEK